MMRMVTGLFYEKAEAEKAAEGLRSLGIPSANVYIETEVVPHFEKHVRNLETERRFAGTEAGIIIGLIAGLLAGFGVGILGSSLDEVLTKVADQSAGISWVLTSPMWSALFGVFIGTVFGGMIGWVIDYTLNKLGAGPSLPAQETLVTVYADAARLDDIYTALQNARVRHLHIAETPKAPTPV